MAENNNSNQNPNPEAGEKTFSQADVNRIVADRLARERDKRTAELDEREQALRRRELAVIAREKLDEAGLNKELCDVLRFDDEAALDEAISKLKNIKGFNAENPEKSGRKIFIENKLPPVGDIESPDLIKEAFKLPTNWS